MESLSHPLLQVDGQPALKPPPTAVLSHRPISCLYIPPQINNTLRWDLFRSYPVSSSGMARITSKVRDEVLAKRNWLIGLPHLIIRGLGRANCARRKALGLNYLQLRVEFQVDEVPLGSKGEKVLWQPQSSRELELIRADAPNVIMDCSPVV